MSTFWYDDIKKIESQLVLQCAAETIQECFRNYRTCRKDKLLKHELSLITQIPLYASRIIKNFFVRFLYVTRKCKKNFIEVLQKHGHQTTLVNTDISEETINEEIDIDEFYEPEVAAAGYDDTTNESSFEKHKSSLYSGEINTDVVNGFIDDIVVSAIEEINNETYDNESNSSNKNPLINHLVDNIIQSAIQEIDDDVNDELSYYDDNQLLNRLVDGVVKSAIDALSDDDEVEDEYETDTFHDQEIVSSEQQNDDAELYEKNLKQHVPLYTTHIAVNNTIKQLDDIEDGMFNDDIANITPKNESSNHYFNENSSSNKAIKQENKFYNMSPQSRPVLSENDYLCKNVTHSTSVSPLRFNKNRNNLMIDKLFKEAVVCRCAIVKMETKEVIKILNAIDIDTSSHNLNSPIGLSSSSSLSTTSNRSFNPSDHIFVPILHAASLAAALTKFIKDNINNNINNSPETDIQMTQDLAEITSDNLKNLVIGSWDNIRAFILKTTGSENAMITHTSSSLKHKLKNTIKNNNANGYNCLINPTNEKIPGRPSNWSSDTLLEFLELLKLSDTTMASFKLSNMKCIRFLDLDEDVLMPGQSYDIKSSLMRTRVVVYQHILNEIESLWDLNIRPWDIYNPNNPVIAKNTTNANTNNNSQLSNTGRSTLTDTTNHTKQSGSTLTSTKQSITKNKDMNNKTAISSRSATTTLTSTSKPKDLISTHTTNDNNRNTDDNNSPNQKTNKSKSKDKIKSKTKKSKKDKNGTIKTLYGDGLPTYEQFLSNEKDSDKIIIEIAPFELLLEAWMLLNRTYGWNINYTDITELAMQIGGNHGYLISSAEELYREYIVGPTTTNHNDSYNSNTIQHDSNNNNNNNNNENINKVNIYDEMKYMRWVALTVNNAIAIGMMDDTSSLSLYNSLETDLSYGMNISPHRASIQHPSSDSFNPIRGDQKYGIDDINNSHTYSGKSSLNSTLVPRLPPLPLVPMNSTGGFNKKSIQIDTRKYPYITANSKNNLNEISILIPLTCLRIEKSVSLSSKNTSTKNSLYDISLSLHHKHIMNNLRIGDQVQIVEESLLIRACERFDWWDRPPADTLTAMAGKQGEIISLLELDKNRRIGVRVTLKTAIPNLINTLTSSGRAVMDALPIESLFLIPNNTNITTTDVTTSVTNNISHNSNSNSKTSKETNKANNKISTFKTKETNKNIISNHHMNSQINNKSSFNNDDNDNTIEDIETDEILDEQLVSSEQQNHNNDYFRYDKTNQYSDEDNIKNENSEFSELEFPHTNINNDYKSWMKTPDKIHNDVGYNRNENLNNKINETNLNIKNNKTNQLLSSSSTPIFSKQSSNITTSITNNTNTNNTNTSNISTNNNISSAASSSHIGVKTVVKTHEWSFPGTNTPEVENRPKSPHMSKQTQQSKTYSNIAKKKPNINDVDNTTRTNIILATNIAPNNVQSGTPSSTFFRNKFLQKSTALLEKIDFEYRPDKDNHHSPIPSPTEDKGSDENEYDEYMTHNDRNRDTTKSGTREGNHNASSSYNQINRHSDYDTINSNHIPLSPTTTKSNFNNITNTTTTSRPRTPAIVSEDIKKHLSERHQYKNNKIQEKEKQSKLRQMYTFNTSGDHGHKPIYTPDKLPDFVLDETQNNIDLGMSLTGRAFHKVNNEMSDAVDLLYEFQSNNISETLKRTSSAPSVSQGTRNNQNHSRANFVKKQQHTDNLLMEDL